MKIALIFRSYGPYHLARLRAARKHHSILALEYSAVDKDYPWDAAREKRDAGVIALTGSGSLQGSARRSFVRALCREMRKFSPDAVAIPGYSESFAVTALRTCRAIRIPTILMSDTHAGSTRNAVFRESVKKKLISLYDAALVAGTPQVEYLSGLGFAWERMALGYDVVDNQHFSARSRCPVELHHAPTAARYFFCCARFVERKNLALLIEAFTRYLLAVGGEGWDLVIAGDGPLRAALQRRVAATSFAGHIHLIGHKSYEELPLFYQAAGAFVLPSLADEWGLVVNEAMAAGLPVIVSKHAGCSRDLVEYGLNGFTFDPTSADELAARMRLIAISPRREEMGRASHRIIAGWDVNRFASGLSQAAETAHGAPHAQHSRFGTAFAAVLSHRS
ncbi:MAG: glycosyltransferase family 4 protein [Proteobacteria bacterium]|nr:glycosyltransferase family 4 protein [Pseudomonadota bacterium]